MAKARSHAEEERENRSSLITPAPTSTAAAPTVGATSFAQSRAVHKSDGSAKSSGGSGESLEEKKLRVAAIASAFCWVAAEYYPRDTMDWRRCRAWVLTHPRLTDWYAENGEEFAKFLRTHPICWFLFHPVVLFARLRGRL